MRLIKINGIQSVRLKNILIFYLVTHVNNSIILANRMLVIDREYCETFNMTYSMSSRN